MEGVGLRWAESHQLFTAHASLHACLTSPTADESLCLRDLTSHRERQVSQKKEGGLAWAEVRHPHLTGNTCVTPWALHITAGYTQHNVPYTSFHMPCHNTHLTTHAGDIMCTQYSVKHTDICTLCGIQVTLHETTS